MINQIKNPTFGGFKPDAMQRIAGTLGYTGDMSGFQQYLEQNPEKRTPMDQFKQAAMMMAKGGAVSKGQPYVVGENGPEMFVPNSTGQITQNARGTGNGVSTHGSAFRKCTANALHSALRKCTF